MAENQTQNPGQKDATLSFSTYVLVIEKIRERIELKRNQRRRIKRGFKR